MHSQVEVLWWSGVMGLALFVTLVLCLVVCLVVLWRQDSPPAMARRAAAVLMLALISALVLVLSGCGTAPSLAPTRLWVPAELLTPPAPPVLLMPGSGLRPPGSTTPPTLRLAPRTGLGISA